MVPHRNPAENQGQGKYGGDKLQSIDGTKPQAAAVGYSQLHKDKRSSSQAPHGLQGGAARFGGLAEPLIPRKQKEPYKPPPLKPKSKSRLPRNQQDPQMGNMD